MLVLKLAEETLSADEVVVEDAPRGAQEFRDQGSRTPRASWSSCTFLYALHQELEHPDSDGMREGLEERRLERLKFLGGHVSYRHIVILHSLHVSRSAADAGVKNED